MRAFFEIQSILNKCMTNVQFYTEININKDLIPASYFEK